MTERELRVELAAAAHRLYQRGLVVAYEGNLSARLPADAVPASQRRRGGIAWLCSPARCCKGELEARDFLRMDDATARGGQPSSEWDLHLGVYRHRPEVMAVVHAHPPYATAFACTAKGLAPLLQPELIQLLGGPVPLAPYATPGTDELFASVRPLLGSPVVLLANHGLLAVSLRSVDEACHFAEQVEQVARITHLALALDSPRPLTSEQLARLR